MSRKLASLTRAALLVSAVALLPATTAGLAAVDARSGPQFGKLVAIYQLVKANYVDKVDDDKLIKGAIEGMLTSLDPHSSYLDGASLQRLETMIDGKYSGLGLSVVLDDGAVKVVSPFRGSPAEQVGIKAGDYITHLDGKLYYGGDLDEAVAKMRGVAGTSIRLTIFRPGRDEPFDVTVTRGVIDLEPVTWKLEGTIGVITINEFSRDVGKDVNGAVQDLKQKSGGKLAGLVLDLRSNPGGSLDEAVALSDLFLTSGDIVSQRGRIASENAYYKAESMFKGDVAARLPLIVHCGEEKAVPGAGRDELGNPLLVRVPLSQGVRVIMAHCASLGSALDLDLKRPRPVSAFSLFARLMDEPAWAPHLLGDVSALFQFNRPALAWQTVLARQDWHARLLHGSDYPLPGVGPLYRLNGLVRAGVLDAAHVEVLERVRAHNPLLFDLMLKRLARWQGQGLSAAVFATRRHFELGSA